MADKTYAERQKRKRDRDRKAGLLDVKVQVRTVEQKGRIKRIAKQMREGPIPENHIKDIAVDWQPIDTAPKDRTEILLWLGAPWSRVEIQRWDADFDCWVGREEPSEEGGTGKLIPTHWMPLPTKPSK